MTRINQSGAQRSHLYFSKIRSVIVTASLCVYLSNGFATTVYGTYDCGQWFVSTKRELAKAWLMGYLSGINFLTADPKAGYDPLGRLSSADQMFLWMDNYCKANPLKSINSGAQDLFLELQRMK